jgi:hypothetical protein
MHSINVGIPVLAKQISGLLSLSCHPGKYHATITVTAFQKSLTSLLAPNFNHAAIFSLAITIP